MERTEDGETERMARRIQAGWARDARPSSTAVAAPHRVRPWLCADHQRHGVERSLDGRHNQRGSGGDLLRTPLAGEQPARGKLDPQRRDLQRARGHAVSQYFRHLTLPARRPGADSQWRREHRPGARPHTDGLRVRRRGQPLRRCDGDGVRRDRRDHRSGGDPRRAPTGSSGASPPYRSPA